MAAVHFIITIPTEKEEHRLRKRSSSQKRDPCDTASTSTRLIPNPTNPVNVYTANLFFPTTLEGQYGTFSTGRYSETKRALGGDIIVNEACSTRTLGMESGVNQPSMQKSSARCLPHKKEEGSYDWNLAPDTSMEIVVRKLLQMFQIDNAVWTMDNEGQKLQISFTIDFDEKYEGILEKLIEWRIGESKGSAVSVMNCIASMTSSKQKSDEDDNGQNINLQKESGWHRFMNSVRCKLNVAQIVRNVRQEASITFDFIVLVVAAAILASFGLVEDSSIFLASSMLISPLMGPIIAAIFGTVIKDVSLGTMGLVNELLGILIATFVGFVFGLVVCSVDNRYGVGEGLTNEMLSRCELHAIAVGIFTALASGAAAAVGVLGGNIGSLIGVAISASLLPPAVNTGLLWALAALYKFYEADSTQYNSVVKTSLYSNYQAAELVIMGWISMCLTISNVVCVYLMGIIVLKIKEIAPASSGNNRRFWKHDLKVARDLNKNGFNDDATFIDDYLGLPKHDQNMDPNCNCTRTNYLGRSSYQNTWSPSSGHHLDAFYLNLPKSSTNAVKHNFRFKSNIRRKSHSMDLWQYQHIAENIAHLETTPNDVKSTKNGISESMNQHSSETQTPNTSSERRRNFIVTPALDQLHCPDRKS